MKFGQVEKVKSHADNEAGRLVPDLFLFFRKALYEVKASVIQLSFKYFDSLQLGLKSNQTVCIKF